MNFRYRFIALNIAIMFVVMCFTVHAQQLATIISVPQTTIKSGDPVRVHIVLSNSSDHEITIFKSVGSAVPEFFYLFSVSKEDGTDLEMTQYGHQLKNKEVVPVSRIMMTLKPGDRLEEDVNLSALFNLEMPGLYRIRAQRQDPLTPNETSSSNILVLTTTQ